MRLTAGVLRILAVAGAVLVAAPAWAQPDDNANISFESGIKLRKPKAGLPDVKAQPLAWPRLDPGAVLCRSEADLDRLAHRRAGEAVEGPVDCQVIRAATAISIVQRKGPGRTEVRGPAQNGAIAGWTDAWLPEKAPAGVAAAR